MRHTSNLTMFIPTNKILHPSAFLSKEVTLAESNNSDSNYNNKQQ